MDMLVDYYMWGAVLKHYQRHMLKLANRAKRPFCRRYRMICFTSSLIRQLYQFASDLNRVLLQLVGTYIVNTV